MSFSVPLSEMKDLMGMCYYSLKSNHETVTIEQLIDTYIDSYNSLYRDIDEDPIEESDLSLFEIEIILNFF